MNSVEPVVVIDKLQVRRGGKPVLRNLSLTVPRGAVVGLLGPSGGGKTTLMRAIVGAQKIASGTVTVFGLAAGHPQLRGLIGYDTQAASVYADLTVRQNLAYFRSVLGADRSDIDQVIDQTDLLDQSAQLVSTLSGGQLSRVSLAVAMLGRPQLLVLDEPTVGLDPVLRVELWNLFHALAERGLTLLVSSHVMDEASRCDRLLLIREGELLADATPAELLASTGAADTEAAFLALIHEHPPLGHPAHRADGPNAEEGA